MSIVSNNGDDDDSNFFGGLSISSLVSDDYQNDTKDSDGGSALYQRLQDLEEMASNFIADRPVTLVNGHTTFTEIEGGKTQEFEIRIHQLSPHEVVTIEIKILPRHNNNNDIFINNDSNPLNSKKGRILNISLSSKSTNMSYNPTYVNGTYSLALSTAHGIAPGLYTLYMNDSNTNTSNNNNNNNNNEMELVSIWYTIVPAIQSVIPLEANKLMKGSVEANEFVYYRYVNQNSSKFINITMKPIYDLYGHVGDADLYVTNRYNGLVPVTRESYIWRSTNVGVDTISIHPHDDNTKYGSTYIVGVFGYKVSTFEISITSIDPMPIIDLEVNKTIDVEVLPDKYNYFCMRIDPSKKTKIGVSLSSLSSRSSPSKTATNMSFNIKEKYGRCVHTTDTLAASGVFGPLISSLSSSFLSSTSSKSNPSSPPSSSSILRSYQSPDRNQPSISSLSYKDQDKFNNALELENIPPSAALERLVFPIAFISSSSMYPNIIDHMWRSSGTDGEISFVINQDEWKYTDGTCYFSIYGLNACSICPNSSTNTSGTYPLYRLCISTIEDAPTSLSMLETIYQNIDSNIVSQRERYRLSLDSHALTYAETDCTTFIEILAHADVGDGMVFYDLGSGSGQCLLTAALSNCRFFKVVGIEILPGLCEISRKCTQTVKDMIAKDNTKAANNNDTYNQFRNSNYYSINNNTNDVDITLPLIEIREGNLLEFDWSDGDLIYFSSLCFPDDMMRDIFLKCLNLKAGTKIITLKLIDGYQQYFRLQKFESMKFLTCGNMTVYYLIKL